MMKTLSSTFLVLFFSFATLSVTGCGGGDSQPASMTDGVELSEIEAYEKSVMEMESEDAGDMDMK